MDITDDIRELREWLAVFDQEYDLPQEVVIKLESIAERLAAKAGVESPFEAENSWGTEEFTKAYERRFVAKN